MKFKESILDETIKATYNPEAFAAQLNKGLEQVAEGSKISMKAIAQQNAAFLNSITKALSGPSLANPFGFVFGGQALESCIAMQKEMLARAMEQSTAVLEVMQEAGKTADKATAEFTNMIQQSLAAAEKEITELTVKPLNSSSR